MALNTVGAVRHLTLRTPTLDDVFLELTGNHIQSEDGGSAGPTCTNRPSPKPWR